MSGEYTSVITFVDHRERVVENYGFNIEPSGALTIKLTDGDMPLILAISAGTWLMIEDRK